MSTRVLLRPWLVPVCRQCSRQSVPSSTRRLYSSEISTTEPSASRPNNGAAGRTTDGAFDHGLDEHTFPIGSSNLSKESTNTETRSDSSGTGIGCISRYANNWTEGGARHPRNGTVDRSLGIGGRIIDASRPAQAGMRRSGQGLRSMSTIPHTRNGDSSGADSDSQPSSTVILTGVGATLLEVDIRRLIARKKHLPEFRDDNDIVRVIPSRDVNSLARRPIYHLTFANSIAAQEFVNSMTPASDQKPAEWTDVRFPPASKPEFSVLDHRSASIPQELVVRDIFTTGGGEPGQCVLLTICGVGGRTRPEGMLPRTDDVRAILEEREVELCKEDIKAGGSGVQRILIEAPGGKQKKGRVVKYDGRGLGAESRWLIRCGSPSEAHRVVRELHMRKPWEGCGRFRAEVIY